MASYKNKGQPTKPNIQPGTETIKNAETIKSIDISKSIEAIKSTNLTMSDESTKSNESTGETPVDLPVSSQRLSSKYLWLSLLVALIPLVSFATLYDSYFSQLVSRLTDEQLATRLAATENEFRVFLRERKYELESLADQFDNPDIFEAGGRHKLSPELENLLRLQMDSRTIYGIAFFNSSKQLSWTFPKGVLGSFEENPSSVEVERSIEIEKNIEVENSIQFEGTEIIGPSPHSQERPSWLILRKPLLFQEPLPQGQLLQEPAFQKQQQPIPSIGMILRFNSLTETLRGLDQSGAYRPLLQVADGRRYDVVGQISRVDESSFHLPLLPGWALHLVQNRELVSTPTEQMRFWLIFLVGSTVAGLILLHLGISRRLNRQVESLISSVERVASGDLETPVAPVQSVEMSRLTQAIERMRQQLKSVIGSTVEVERRASLGQLAAGLAHDIRNPLTTIRTTVTALTRREKDKDNREMLVMIEEEIQRFNDVIENLLNFARPREPHAENIKVTDLLDSIMTLTDATARQQNICLSTRSPDSLTLCADEGHLRQVLMNLILNALQAMGDKGGSLCIAAEEDGGQILLSVSDNGPGISDDIQTHILEPFYTTKPAGTGLGLAICSVLVKNNGGSLEIKSTEGEGTTILLRLPAAKSMDKPMNGTSMETSNE